ncbi:hypothetical protein ABIF73_000838 [Bradyrhizobium japonicum]
MQTAATVVGLCANAKLGNCKHNKATHPIAKRIGAPEFN